MFDIASGQYYFVCAGQLVWWFSAEPIARGIERRQSSVIGFPRIATG
jgi:hypothetical protein